MNNVVQLFPRRAAQRKKATRQRTHISKKAKDVRRSNLDLISQAGRIAHSIKQLSSIDGCAEDLVKHLTYRNEQEMVKCLKTTVELLIRFAEELKINVSPSDYRNSELARK